MLFLVIERFTYCIKCTENVLYILRKIKLILHQNVTNLNPDIVDVT